MLAHFLTLSLRIATAVADEEGQGVTEYALMLALIAVVAVVAVTFLGTNVTEELSTVASTV